MANWYLDTTTIRNLIDAGIYDQFRLDAAMKEINLVTTEQVIDFGASLPNTPNTA